MTQTITKCNETPQGKRYPIEHLRTPASIEQLFEYVDAGHPIAACNGAAIKCIRANISGSTDYDEYDRAGFWLPKIARNEYLLIHIKLAPLAYRNGRPLHVGDDIEFLYLECWNKASVTLETLDFYTNKCLWHFVDEVAK